jgi:group I intron endonuclease
MATRNSDPGIYVIRNATTGREYVGSSRDVAQRLATHRRRLESGRHNNGALQADWLIYGPEAFTFAQVETCEPTELALQEAEDRHIKARENCYNFAPAANRWHAKEPLKPLDGDSRNWLIELMAETERVKRERLGIAPDEQAARWEAVEASMRDSLERLDDLAERIADLRR